MSYIPYKPSANSWNNIQGQPYGKRFYLHHRGQGTPIQIVSPAQGSIQRAKLDLKRQLNDAEAHSPPSKRRRSIAHSKKKNNSATKSKSKKKTLKTLKKVLKKTITKKKKKK